MKHNYPIKYAVLPIKDKIKDKIKNKNKDMKNLKNFIVAETIVNESEITKSFILNMKEIDSLNFVKFSTASSSHRSTFS